MWEICRKYQSVLSFKNSILNSNVEVSWLAKKLFQKHPSIIETQYCYECHNRVKDTPLIAMPIAYEEIESNANFLNVITNEIWSSCPICGTADSVKSEISGIGRYLIIIVFIFIVLLKP